MKVKTLTWLLIRRVSTLCALMVIVFSSISYAQLNPAYGVLFLYNSNIHSADFRAFPGVPSCCPKYETGSGSGFNIGLLFQLPLSENIRLGLRGTYNNLSGTLERTESEVLSGGVQGAFVHQVISNISDIGLEPIVQYRPINSLWINAGFRAGYLASKTFSQEERVQNDGFLFTNGSSRRNVVENATLPQANTILVGLVSGISYDLPLNVHSTVVLAPEISYHLPFVNIVQQIEWKVSQLRIGAALKWSPAPKKEPLQRREEKFEIDTVKLIVEPSIAGFSRGVENRSEIVSESDEEILATILIKRTDTLRIAAQIPISKKNKLSASVSANGLYDDGKEAPTVKLEIEEFSSVLMTPLLPYVFFEENSAEIPIRYNFLDAKALERFREEDVNNPDRLVTYYQLLNIIGKRMRQHPKAVLTLTGCNADIGVEKGNTILSQHRAEAVKKYLVETWAIKEPRIKIESRNLPLKSANTLIKDGAQENRRVEIACTVPAVTAPLITNDTLKTATPPSVRFKTIVTHNNDIADWSLVAIQDNQLLKKFNGTGDVPSSLDWNLSEEKSTQPKTTSDIVYELHVNSTNNETVSTQNTIAVEQVTVHKKKIERIADKEIQRFSLILFDVRSDEITASNKSIVDIIKPYLTPTSTVKIVGYTDRLGDAKQNQVLAEARAKNTEKELGVYTSNSSVTAQGNSSKFSPELPEGRLYTRTVDIVIETPVKE